MDATLNDFLNEINEIAPPVKKKTCDWQECFDEGTGFPYYWNVDSNAVTWEMPAEYKEWLDGGKNKKLTAKVEPKIQPKVEPLFPGVSLTTAPDSVKIYKIKEEHKPPSPTPRPTSIKHNKTEKIKKSKPPRKRSSDSEDEKIVLISSYGGDTESEDESISENKIKSNHSSQCSSPKPTINSTASSRANSDNEDAESTSSAPKEPTQSEAAAKTPEAEPETPKDVPSGFALVAGYGDSDEEEESFQENGTAEEPSAPVSHSTLFPVTKPIDVNQFMEAKPAAEKPEETVDIDTKVFQRKRRIGINFTRPKIGEGAARKGLGFKAEGAGFKSGGVAFVKSDVLYPSVQPEKQNGGLKDSDDAQATVKEKLIFLSEGREPVSPVQMMLIQLETLYAALKYGSLDSNYLNKWIKETCEELVKLEEEAAPNGWLLQWDRSQKRYYYRNKGTDECQWEYPPAAGEDDAMDICTTPPPPVDNAIEMDQAIMPSVSPTPMGNSDNENIGSPVVEELSLDRQPLPPGVDSVDHKPSQEGQSDLSFALNSFYSDIAAIENVSTSPKPHKGNEQKDPMPNNVDTNTEPAKKKKKVKMASGISMKKKGVSKLVEKWKNVQKDLD